MEEEDTPILQPKYYYLLSSEDKRRYDALRGSLSSSACRNRRGKRLESFQSMLNTIYTYCIHEDDEDWKRLLACGICWLSGSIAVNTRHLTFLLNKCKSSINGSLQKLGYTTLTSHTGYTNQLLEKIPFLKTNYTEQREWTIRQTNACTPHLEPACFPLNLREKLLKSIKPIPQRHLTKTVSTQKTHETRKVMGNYLGFGGYNQVNPVISYNYQDMESLELTPSYLFDTDISDSEFDGLF